MSNVLLIDDDAELGGKLKTFFSDFGLNLDFITDPLGAQKQLTDKPYDVLILDGMMPGKDGFDLCREIRNHSMIPIIFLTGRVEEADRILGLENGADDYVTKPFSPRELVARVKSQIRRLKSLEKSASQKTLVDNTALEIMEELYEVRYEGKKISLTASEFEILHFLYSYRGEVKSREEIMQGLHGDSWEAFDRSLDIAISRIRKKIKEVAGEREFIKTIRSKGYTFLGSEND